MKSRFEDGDGGGVLLGVAEADEEGTGGTGVEEGQAAFVEDDVGLPGGFSGNFHVAPAEFGADAGAEGFGDGFLGGEAGGEEGAGDAV